LGQDGAREGGGVCRQGCTYTVWCGCEPLLAATPLRECALSVYHDKTCLNASHAITILHSRLALPLPPFPCWCPPPPPLLHSVHEQAPGSVGVTVQEQATEEAAEEEAAAVQEEAEEEAAAVDGAKEEAAEEAMEEVGASLLAIRCD
jgi:hypothetical protein